MSERAARKCGGKSRHRSERRANAEAKRLQHRTGVAMKAYSCEYCKGWHVGSVNIHDRPESELPRAIRYAWPTRDESI